MRRIMRLAWARLIEKTMHGEDRTRKVRSRIAVAIDEADIRAANIGAVSKLQCRHDDVDRHVQRRGDVERQQRIRITGRSLIADIEHGLAAVSVSDFVHRNGNGLLVFSDFEIALLDMEHFTSLKGRLERERG